MPEAIEMPTTQELDVRKVEEKLQAARQALDFVRNENLAVLSKCELVPIDNSIKAIDIKRVSRLFQITDIVYAKDEDFLHKAMTVAYTAFSQHAKIIVVLNSDGQKNDYLMGISMPDDKDSISAVSAGFENAFRGSFSGSKTTHLDNSAFSDKMHCYFEGRDVYTSISGIPSLRYADKHNIEGFVQGMENLVDSLRGESYTLLIISEAASHESIAELRSAYQRIYTSISPFAKTDCNFNASEAFGKNQSISLGHTHTVTHNESTGSSETKGSSISTAHTDTESRTRDTAGKAALSLAGVVAGGVIGFCVGGPVGAALGVAAGTGLSSISGLMGSQTSGVSDTTTESKSDSHTTNQNVSDGESNANSETQSQGTNETSSSGRSIQFSIEDRVATDTLKLIEKNIERLDKCESFGAFSSAAYVISNSEAVNNHVASVFSALMRGDESHNQAALINTWGPKHPETVKVGEYLRRLMHPEFNYRIGEGNATFTPAVLLSGEEMALQFCLPKKSIPGVSVRTMAEFGCNPPYPTSSRCKLGVVQRRGESQNMQPVAIDCNSLTAHAFITGSTGAGKSNAIYKILDELSTQDVHFMVIEPAKGEYKNIFGTRSDVSVYGTNPQIAPLLRLNPFAFPKNIHVLEHIDRLVEIFNACWPMYAAMPAVLKDSIERAYISCGWNLTQSASQTGRYPTFLDVLSALPEIIDASSYSSDTKGDYIGALVTRVQSLTNGINGMLFRNMDAIPDEKLFDENVIIDLSRVGSSETKALLMGMLMIKLHEHRMSVGGMNSELKHVTVLEEAHNLLRRTSTEQSQESSNLQGKSVEMLANAIAEMRTYGEGFIIADQAPGLLDKAVIRNTNTKIILRLPDYEDREIAGRAASLNDDQIEELAKLERGVAAVFQNDWMEPVLVAIDCFEHNDEAYYYTPPADTSSIEMNALFRTLLGPSDRIGELDEECVDRLRKRIAQFDIGNAAKVQLLNMVDGKTGDGPHSQKELIYIISDGSTIVEKTSRIRDYTASRAAADAMIMDQLDVEESTAEAIRRVLYEHAAIITAKQDKPELAKELRAKGGIS